MSPLPHALARPPRTLCQRRRPALATLGLLPMTPHCEEDLLMEEAAAAQCALRPPRPESPDSDVEWDAAAFLRPGDAYAASPPGVSRLP